MKPWNQQNIEGVHRFLKKVWRECLNEEGAVNSRVAATGALAPGTEKLRHETIKKVTEDFDAMRFNTAISQLMIFVNVLQKEPVLPRDVLRDLLSLLAPLAPHLGEELWARLGFEGSAAAASWPTYDPTKLVASTITIVIQVNGKHRGEQEAPVGVSEVELKGLALLNPKVVPYVSGKEIKRVIYVKGRLINLLV